MFDVIHKVSEQAFKNNKTISEFLEMYERDLRAGRVNDD